jgi:hypothetical protein
LPAAAGVITLVTILLLASRGGGAARPVPGPPPQRDTAQGAQVAAQQVFELYSAGQYRTVYGDLVPAVRSAVSEPTWVAVHRQCRIAPTGGAFTVASLALAGEEAVVTVSVGPADQTQVFDYIAGKWLWVPSGDLSAYQGSVAQIVSRLKSEGYCGS